MLIDHNITTAMIGGRLTDILAQLLPESVKASFCYYAEKQCSEEIRRQRRSRDKDSKYWIMLAEESRDKWKAKADAFFQSYTRDMMVDGTQAKAMHRNITLWLDPSKLRENHLRIDDYTVVHSSGKGIYFPGAAHIE